jgi:hypothetical protein
MAFLSVVINGIAVATTSGNPVAIGSLVAAIWAWGIASNYRADPMSIPNYASMLGVLSLIVGPIMLVVGLAS